MTVETLDFWRSHSLTTDELLSWTIGDFVIQVRHTAHEWQFSRRPLNDSDASVSWKRFTTGSEEPILQPVPVMPDLSVIVRPEAPIHLAPGHEAVFFVSIPLWLRLTAGNDASLVLCDDPLVNLSKTWFGEPVNGELCYSLRTRARRENDVDKAKIASRAVSEVVMRNEADHMLEFERLCLPAKHLNVYRAANQLRADHVTVVYGKNSQSQVRIKGRPTEIPADTPPLGKAREEVASGGHILQRNFGRLRTFLQ